MNPLYQYIEYAASLVRDNYHPEMKETIHEFDQAVIDCDLECMAELITKLEEKCGDMHTADDFSPGGSKKRSRRAVKGAGRYGESFDEQSLRDRIKKSPPTKDPHPIPPPPVHGSPEDKEWKEREPGKHATYWRIRRHGEAAYGGIGQRKESLDEQFWTPDYGPLTPSPGGEIGPPPSDWPIEPPDGGKKEPDSYPWFPIDPPDGGGLIPDYKPFNPWGPLEPSPSPWPEDPPNGGWVPGGREILFDW